MHQPSLFDAVKPAYTVTEADHDWDASANFRFFLDEVARYFNLPDSMEVQYAPADYYGSQHKAEESYRLRAAREVKPEHIAAWARWVCSVENDETLIQLTALLELRHAIEKAQEAFDTVIDRDVI